MLGAVLTARRGEGRWILSPCAGRTLPRTPISKTFQGFGGEVQYPVPTLYLIHTSVRLVKTQAASSQASGASAPSSTGTVGLSGGLSDDFAALARDYREMTRGAFVVMERLESGSIIVAAHRRPLAACSYVAGGICGDRRANQPVELAAKFRMARLRNADKEKKRFIVPGHPLGQRSSRGDLKARGRNDNPRPRHGVQRLH